MQRLRLRGTPGRHPPRMAPGVHRRIARCSASSRSAPGTVSVSVSRGAVHHAMPNRGAKGGLVSDAHLSALAIEAGATPVAGDRGMRRCPGVQVRRPLDSDRPGRAGDPANRHCRERTTHPHARWVTTGSDADAQPCAPGSEGRARTSNIRLQRPAFCQLNYLGTAHGDVDTPGSDSPSTSPQASTGARMLPDLAKVPSTTPISCRSDANPRGR